MPEQAALVNAPLFVGFCQPGSWLGEGSLLGAWRHQPEVPRHAAGVLAGTGCTLLTLQPGDLKHALNRMAAGGWDGIVARRHC